MKYGVVTIFTVLIAFAEIEAASITTETFSAGANGWVGSLSLGNGSWSYTSNAAQITFNNTEPISIPDIGTLSNQHGATTGLYSGDYTAAGITIIGFKFFAETELPSGITLFLGGSSNLYLRLFDIAQAGVWYTLSASLVNPELEGWVSLKGSLSNFDATLADVQYVGINVARSGVLKQRFVIDDIFLDRQPVAIEEISSGSSVIVWGSLRIDEPYVVEASTDLVQSPWSIVDVFTATGATYRSEFPTTNRTLFFRMTKE